VHDKMDNPTQSVSEKDKAAEMQVVSLPPLKFYEAVQSILGKGKLGKRRRKTILTENRSIAPMRAVKQLKGHFLISGDGLENQHPRFVS